MNIFSLLFTFCKIATWEPLESLTDINLRPGMMMPPRCMDNYSGLQRHEPNVRFALKHSFLHEINIIDLIFRFSICRGLKIYLPTPISYMDTHSSSANDLP